MFDKVDNDVIGAIKDRRDRNTRSKAEGDVKDILAAMARLDNTTHTPIFAVSSYQINNIPRCHPDELSSISVIDRLKDLEGKYKQCQLSVDQLLSDNAVLKERMVKVEQDKRPSYRSVISGPIVPAQQRTQLKQRQRTQGLKEPTKPSILHCINSDRAAGTVPNIAVN